MAHENQKQTNGKEKRVNCPHYQEKYEFEHAAHFSGRKKMLERKSWSKEHLARICVYNLCLKSQSLQNRAVQLEPVLLSVCDSVLMPIRISEGIPSILCLVSAEDYECRHQQGDLARRKCIPATRLISANFVSHRRGVGTMASRYSEVQLGKYVEV